MDVLSLQWCGHVRGLPRAAACWMALAAIAAGTSALLPIRVMAQTQEPTEYQVKAAFLFNFAKFVEWPDTSFADGHAPIVLGILGENPFENYLSQMVARQFVKGRTIRIRRYQFGDDLRSCQVLFVSASQRARVPRILASLQGSGVLTVSDLDGFAAAGGVMQFVMEESRVRFLINLDAALQAKLRINSKLLALAHVVNRADVRGTN